MFLFAWIQLLGSYWPAAGDLTLGVAKVLLLGGGLLVDVALPLLALGKPELGDFVPMPLPELVMPGVP